LNDCLGQKSVVESEMKSHFGSYIITIKSVECSQALATIGISASSSFSSFLFISLF